MSGIIQKANTNFMRNQVFNNGSPISQWVTVVLFGHSQCGACPLAYSTIEQLALNYAGRIYCYYVDTMENAQLAQQLGIMAVPTVMVFKNGQVLERITGNADYYRYNRMIASYI